MEIIKADEIDFAILLYEALKSPTIIMVKINNFGCNGKRADFRTESTIL